MSSKTSRQSNASFKHDVMVDGNISVVGTVDGRNVSTDGTNQDSHISSVSAHGVSGNVVGDSDSQTLSNKTISAANNTIVIDTDDVSEGSAMYYTTSRFDGRFSSKTTDHLVEGSAALYYTSSRFNDAFASKTTDDLPEGASGLYYTPTRFDARLASKTTDDIAEGSALYYTEGRFDSRLSMKTTNNLAEGASGLYYTDGRVDTRLSSKTTDDIAEGSGALYYTDGRFDSRFASKTSSDLTEGASGLYYTEARVSANSAVANATTHSTLTNNPHSVTAEQLGLGSVANILSKLDATSPPTTTNDSSEGYGVGSKWVDVNSNRIYQCVDSSVGSAVWRRTDITDHSDLSGTGTNTHDQIDSHISSTSAHGVSGNIVGDSDSQTLTNKTINAANNTLTIDTDDVTEGAINRYYTTARFDTRLATKTTDDLTEGAGALYYTEARVSANAAVAAATTHSTLTNNPHSVTKAQVGLGSVSNTLNKLDATVVPTTTDDSASGYSVGSKWIDVTADRVYECVDVSVGASIWRRTDVTDHSDLSGIGTNTHAQIDSHISATAAHGVSGNIVGDSDSQTLTNKTINAANNTLVIDTDDVTEGAAQYFTNARADARITAQKGNANGLATLDGGGKVPASQLSIDGGVSYQGNWNANTNTPTITSSTGTKGEYYVVSASGTTSIDGITDWQSTDWIIFNGTVWEKNDNTNSVTSVAGKQGSVTLTASDITDLTTDTVSEGAAMYYTTSRFDTRLATKTTDDLTEGPINHYYTEARVSANTDVAAATTHSTLTNNPHSVTKAQVGLGSVADTKVKLDATSAPSSTDDSDSGYSVGSKWINVSSDRVYICVDATVGSAVWRRTDIIDHSHLSGTGTNTHAQIDTHISSTSEHGVSGNIVGDSDSQTLTNKTISAANNTLTIDTDDVPEGAAMYYTEGRFDTRLATKTTSDLTEGSGLYYTEARVSANAEVAAATTHSTLTNNPHSVTKAQVGLTNVINTKVKLDATVAPTTTNDSASGYSVGSKWVDISADRSYECMDSSVGAAVWRRTDITDHSHLSGIGTNTHSQIDTHISSTSAHGVSGNIVGDSDSQTLTNKTISAANNTLTLDTDDVPEGAALYYTTSRFDTRLATKTTNDLTEGPAALYYTEARVSANTDVATATTHSTLTNNPHSVTKAQVGLSSVIDTLHKFDATGLPTSTDDSASGYSVGSIWIYDGLVGQCVDATVGSSVWRRLDITDHSDLGGIGTNTHSQIDSHISSSIAHGIGSNIVGEDDSQTLTNKTINTSHNTIVVDASDITTGVVGVTRGGSGQTTLIDAFNSFAPSTATGDLIVFDGTNNVRLQIGSNKSVLYSNGTSVEWNPITIDTRAALQIRRSTIYSLETSWTALAFNETDVETDSTVIEHSNTRVLIKEDGLYRVTLQVPLVSTSGIFNPVFGRIMLNDVSAVIDTQSSLYGSSPDTVGAILTGNSLLNFTGGDYITLELMRTFGSIDTSADVVLTVIKEDGIRGERGPTGSGSTITLKDGGATVANTPHSILNFIGGIVSDDGSGEASITMPSTTVTNLGATGEGIYKQTTNFDIELKKIAIGSDKLSLTASSNNIVLDIIPSNIYINDFNGAPLGTIVGNIDSQTLTNKTISAASNTITIDTDDVTEGTNALYYTDARFDTRFASKKTDDLTEGSALYYTNSRADARITLQKAEPNGLATLDGSGKVPASQLSLDNVDYQGGWNAATNSPTITSSVGTKGHYYVVSIAGSTYIDGQIDWQPSDWIIFNGTIWEKADHSNAVTSVAGKQGVVTLAASDITSGEFVDARISESSVTQHNASLDHGLMTGLGDDDHAQYPLSGGRSAGQTIKGGTLANNNLTLESTSHATKGAVISKDRMVIKDAGFATSYECSVQSNTSSTFLEILNIAGTNKGGRFGIEDDNLGIYNSQGGDMLFYTHTLPTAGTSRMIIKANGNVEITNLGLGILKSSAAGVLSHETENTAFNKAFGTLSGTVSEGDHTHTPSQVGLSNVANTLHNGAGSAPPTTSDDSIAGYSIGSIWIDTVTNKSYICVDASVGAAVWNETVVATSSQTLTNKTMTATTNNITAASLHSATTIVDTSSSAPPSLNQVLTATSPTSAEWKSPAGGVFGSEFHQVSDDVESTTTQPTFQTKLTLTTSSLPSGTYRLGWGGELSNSTKLEFIEAEIKLDGVIVALPLVSIYNDYLAFSNFVHQSLSGVVTATIKFRRPFNGTAMIRRARLELWRVS